VERAFESQLAEAAQQREVVQTRAINVASNAHDAVLKGAMMDLEMVQMQNERKRLQEEAEKSRRAAEAKQKLDEERAAELRRLQAERERDEARRQEVARVERERKEAEQRATAEKQEKEEQAKRALQQKEKEAADARAAEQRKQLQQQEQSRAHAEQSQTPQPPSMSQPNAAAPAAAATVAVSSRDEVEKEHAAFLAMKQALKQTRDRLDQAKSQDAWLKQNLGEKCRRRIKTLVNQVNKHNREENRRVVSTSPRNTRSLKSHC
jgi:nucleoporin GLE1